MIKTLPVQRLRPGMFLFRFGGTGLHHAFVRHSFVLEPADIRAIIDGGVTEVMIDTDKGLDELPLTPEEEAAAAAAGAADGDAAGQAADDAAGDDDNDGDAVREAAERPLSAVPPPAAAPAVLSGRSSMDQELAKAKRLCNEAKEAVTAMFAEARMGKAVDPERAGPLVEEISSSLARHPDALISVARLKRHDDYTYLHSVAVCALMVTLARRVGMSEQDVYQAGVAGMMHDLGKAMMPLEVLNKPGKLTDEEFDIMRGHPAEGWNLLREGGKASEHVLDVALHHHEKIDGSGYPHRLAGDAISQMAKMGAVCDVYDAISSNRPYKVAWGPAESIQRMGSWKGHFDDYIFKAFVRSLGIYPVGALVRLQSERLGVVLEQGESSLLKPKVRVFFSVKRNEPIFVQVVDLAAPDCADRIVGIESPSKWNFRHLDQLWLSQ